MPHPLACARQSLIHLVLPFLVASVAAILVPPPSGDSDFTTIQAAIEI